MEFWISAAASTATVPGASAGAGKGLRRDRGGNSASERWRRSTPQPSHPAVAIQPIIASPPVDSNRSSVPLSRLPTVGAEVYYFPSVGHLTDGYYTAGGKKISATSIYFESLPYKVSVTMRYIDYDKLEEKVLDFRPKLIICGGIAVLGLRQA